MPTLKDLRICLCLGVLLESIFGDFGSGLDTGVGLLEAWHEIC